MPRSEAVEILLAQLIEEFAASEMGMRHARVVVEIAADVVTVQYAYPVWNASDRPAAPGYAALLQRLLGILFVSFRAQLARMVATYTGLPVADVRTAVLVDASQITQQYTLGSTSRAQRVDARRWGERD